jgi:microcompartment protein CcmK/EutM
MLIGEVVGSVIATRKTDNMEGLPLRLVRKLNPVDATPTAVYVVAVDLLGADTGEVVLITTGSPARQTPRTDNRPVDAVIMAIVDTWQIQGQVCFSRQQPRTPTEAHSGG